MGIAMDNDAGNIARRTRKNAFQSVRPINSWKPGSNSPKCGPDDEECSRIATGGSETKKYIDVASSAVAKKQNDDKSS